MGHNRAWEIRIGWDMEEGMLGLDMVDRVRHGGRWEIRAGLSGALEIRMGHRGG
jgi:hypothetical protein